MLNTLNMYDELKFQKFKRTINVFREKKFG